MPRRLNSSINQYKIQQKLFNFQAEVKTFKFLSNEYRQFPLTMSIDVCKALRENSFGVGRMLLKNGNVSCPFNKVKTFSILSTALLPMVFYRVIMSQKTTFLNQQRCPLEFLEEDTGCFTTSVATTRTLVVLTHIFRSNTVFKVHR